MIQNQINRKVCIVGSGFCGFAAYKKLKEENVELLLVEGEILKLPIRERSIFLQNFSQSNNKISKNFNIKSRLIPLLMTENIPLEEVVNVDRMD